MLINRSLQEKRKNKMKIYSFYVFWYPTAKVQHNKANIFYHSWIFFLLHLLTSQIVKITHAFIQQQQPSLSPKILWSAIDPQQTNQGWPHAFFSIILYYPKSLPP